MATVCYVSAKDYAQHWEGACPVVPEIRQRYDGPDRRQGQERRQPEHDRRWVTTPGRRFRQRRR